MEKSIAHPPGITDDLKQLAEIALKTAQTEMNDKGSLTPTFLARLPDGGLDVVRFEGEAGNVFNSGAAKDSIFDFMREEVKEHGYTAVIFVTKAWMGKQTPKGRALSEQEFFRKTRERGFETAMREGLVERCEVIYVTVQTPGGALMVSQEFIRDDKTKAVVFGDRMDKELGPDEFRGRQKMYGNLRKEWLR